MNKLIVIVGPSGVGKTSLAKALRARFDFATAYEQHNERPFQVLFKSDLKYALVNQMDYLLYRAEQERDLRSKQKPALMDGGLDLDYHGFTRLFHLKGWLSDAEFDLCRRFYYLTRSLLPEPDMIIALSATQQIIGQRLAVRNRINIASSDDAAILEKLIGEWLASIPQNHILHLDVSEESIEFTNCVNLILNKM